MQQIQLEDAVANAEQYISQMQEMDDKKLSKHLDLFREQMQMDYEQKKTSPFSFCADLNDR